MGRGVLPSKANNQPTTNPCVPPSSPTRVRVCVRACVCTHSYVCITSRNMHKQFASRTEQKPNRTETESNQNTARAERSQSTVGACNALTHSYLWYVSMYQPKHANKKMLFFESNKNRIEYKKTQQGQAGREVAEKKNELFSRPRRATGPSSSALSACRPTRYLSPTPLGPACR